MGRPSLGLAFIVGLALITHATAAEDCPLSYTNTNSRSGGLLLGGVANNGACKTSKGQPCPRSGYWVEECKMPTSAQGFAICNDEQREPGMKLAEQLFGGGALKMSPCDLYPYMRGRTLWLLGDSHTKQLYKALQCFMIDFWDQKDCKVSSDDALVKQLDTLPWMPGQSKCLHLMGNGRICRVGAVLGSSLVNNPQVADNGALNLLRDKGLAQPDDIFVIQFGTWHMLKGPQGLDDFKEAVKQLGIDYQKNKAKFPHMIFRESPMTHEKDLASQRCKPAPQGWAMEYSTGKLSALPNARSDAAALLARGGTLNAAARDILAQYDMPVMGGFSYSVPLSAAHVAMRSVQEMDCLHYCSFGLPELLVFELGRLLKGGIAGIKPSPYQPPDQFRSCPPAPSWL